MTSKHPEGSDEYADEQVLAWVESLSHEATTNSAPQKRALRRLAAAGKVVLLEDCGPEDYQGVVVAATREVLKLRHLEILEVRHFVEELRELVAEHDNRMEELRQRREQAKRWPQGERQ